MKRKITAAILVIMMLVCGTSGITASATGGEKEVQIVIDNKTEYQVLEGFGATTISCADWDYNRGPSNGPDPIGAMRNEVIDAVYNKVKLTMGLIRNDPYEGYWDYTRKPSGEWTVGSVGKRPDAYITDGPYQGWDTLVRTNDNDDPFVFDWSHFQWWQSDFNKVNLYDIAKPMGFDNFSLSGLINPGAYDTWLQEIRNSDYERYLQEAAENSVAILIRWRDEYGIVPKWHQPFNEPLDGNREVRDGTYREIIDLIKALGARMEAEGFGDVKLVVPSSETIRTAYDLAKAILADPVAAGYVWAIGYHVYPYNGGYSMAKRVLDSSGVGKPIRGEVLWRNLMRDLAQKYGVQLWMTEVSHSYAGTWDTLRTRAIHIHDEFEYANANAYWGMFNMFDSTQNSEEDHVVVYDCASQTYRITGMGYAIGHYARWLKKGAVRIDAKSSDPLVQVTSFRDDGQGKLVLVAINNSTSERTLEVDVKDLNLKGQVYGEQSTSEGYWMPISAINQNNSKFMVTVPALSVTTFTCGTEAPIANLSAAYVDPGCEISPSLRPRLSSLAEESAGGVEASAKNKASVPGAAKSSKSNPATSDSFSPLFIFLVLMGAAGLIFAKNMIKSAWR